MDGLLLYERRDELDRELGKALADWRKSGYDLARAEQEYRVAKGKRIAQMTADGVRVTVIADLVKSDPEVSELMLVRDMKMVDYKVSPEVVNVLKLRFRSVEEQIKREY